MSTELRDTVNKPLHYNTGAIEVADFINDQRLNFFAGNVVKYVSRASRKHGEQDTKDLQKALWYLAYELGGLGVTVEVMVETITAAAGRFKKEVR